MDRREEILKAAYEILGQDGLEALHARSVAARVGVNHALVHYYFHRREDLLLAVADYLKARFEADVAHFRKDAAEAADRVEANLVQCEAYCKPTSRLYRAWASLFVAAQTSRTLRKSLLDFWAGWVERVDAEIEEGKNDKSVDVGSPFADGRMLLATLLGVGLVAQLTGESGDATRHLDSIESSLLV
jgi:AcrR family transcriptional regulator